MNKKEKEGAIVGGAIGLVVGGLPGAIVGGFGGAMLNDNPKVRKTVKKTGQKIKKKSDSIIKDIWK